jgi:hypothetical protein
MPTSHSWRTGARPAGGQRRHWWGLGGLGRGRVLCLGLPLARGPGAPAAPARGKGNGNSAGMGRAAARAAAPPSRARAAHRIAQAWRARGGVGAWQALDEGQRGRAAGAKVRHTATQQHHQAGSGYKCGQGQGRSGSRAPGGQAHGQVDAWGVGGTHCVTKQWGHPAGAWPPRTLARGLPATHLSKSAKAYEVGEWMVATMVTPSAARPLITDST